MTPIPALPYVARPIDVHDEILDALNDPSIDDAAFGAIVAKYYPDADLEEAA